MTITSLPPGFRFHPTDVELIKFYLQRKVMGKRIRFEVMGEIDIYKFAPWDLPGMSCMKSKDLEWYFYCPREKKYSSGGRMNRATEFGFWKTTGKDRSVLNNGQTVGMIKTLIFHTGKAPKGDRTDWVMHEYRLEDKNLADAFIAQDAYVLCKIFQKSGPGPKNGAQYGAPFIEEEWSDDEAECGPSSFLIGEMSGPAPEFQNNPNSSVVTSTYLPGTTCIESSVNCGPSSFLIGEMSGPAPEFQNNPNSSVVTSTYLPGTTCIESSVNCVNTPPDTDASMIDLPPICDDVLSMLDCFSDDFAPVPFEDQDHNNKVVNNVNPGQNTSSDVNHIYHDLEELIQWKELSDDGLYLELDDLQMPLVGPSLPCESPINPAVSHYNFQNSFGPPFDPLNSFDTGQDASMINQSLVLPEGCLWR